MVTPRAREQKSVRITLSQFPGKEFGPLKSRLKTRAYRLELQTQSKTCRTNNRALEKSSALSNAIAATLYGTPDPADRLCVLPFAVVLAELLPAYCVVVCTSTPLPCSR